MYEAIKFAIRESREVKMKIVIMAMIVVQIGLIGIGCWEITQPELLGYGVFNIVINAIFLPVNIANL